MPIKTGTDFNLPLSSNAKMSWKSLSLETVSVEFRDERGKYPKLSLRSM